MRRVLLAILVAVSLQTTAANAAGPQYLDQSWRDTDRQWFYTTPQGSKLIRYDWALALERASDDTLFFADGLARLGYLSNAKSGTNPDGLPVGFVRDRGLTVDHLGMTCAACHTSALAYKGTTYRIDGGPADADLFGFLAEMSESLSATSASPASAKFRRFAKRLGKDGLVSGPKLYLELRKFSRDFSDFVAATTSTTSWGRARADAFGAIFNRVTAIDLPPAPPSLAKNIPANNRMPNAPVSYPFLWDTSWHNVVQWNGSAPNQLAILRLARNVGEVLGVFAEIEIKKPKPLHWFYKSSAKRINLLEIEDRLAQLRSPHWPAGFPAIDTTQADKGKKIYHDECESCHKPATPGVFQDVVMTPITSTTEPSVGTDPAMATVAANRDAKTGILEGVPEFIIAGNKFGPTALAGKITFNAVLGAIVSPIPDDWFLGAPSRAATKTALEATSTRTGDGSENDLRNDLLSRVHQTLSKTHASSDANTDDPVKNDLMKALDAIKQAKAASPPTGLAYKARPLDGIWATAPYLHNGSVPTLRALLMKPAARPKTFYVGSRDFDPVNVGFNTAAGPGRFLFDTSIPGNFNTGHDWGTSLSNGDLEALLEYLRSL